ncbi:hypothetical protein TSUD_376910 [Trifolium subterraneum]|uniref:Aminotransferase-like plant mobile domain-containing protein n=1 Tax=Trifolium subterraneum TaxID=3900 RepID=A0A2Z6MHP2_TRISU|nr:hypothetical protein TSUD_376910 [Trifolium subterraneum]
MHCVVRTRGRDGRIRHAAVGRGVSMPVEQEQDIDQPVIVEQPMKQEDVAQHGWPGGPLDTSLLTRYADHVARYIWFDMERIEGAKPELCIASLGSKLTGWVPGPAFTERWHPETSSFHMPFGEMTITLDDVACLLHIPVRGIFYTPVPVSMEEAAALTTELLGVPYEEAYLETSRQRGETAYLLLLVGCTILTDKSYTQVNAKWLPMFRDLSTLNKFSWASAALVCLYDNLNDASMFTTHALAGYPTLLQGKTKLPAYRPIMDALTPFDVIWRPFEGHRGSIPSDLITCFCGYLSGCTVVPYLPERCLRQFGLVQYIPPPPPHPAPSYTDIDSLWSSYHTSVDRILQLTRPVRFDVETTTDYLPWYYTVSHPILCCPHDGLHGAPPVPQFVPAYAPPEADPVPQDAPAQDAPPAHAPPSGQQRRMDAIVSALERFIAQVDADRDDDRRMDAIVSALERFIAQVDADRDDDVFDDIFYALDVARGDRDID